MEIVSPKSNTPPLKAIRQYCLQCGNGTRKEVDECPIVSCPLYIYRYGMTLKAHEKMMDKEANKRKRRKTS